MSVTAKLFVGASLILSVYAVISASLVTPTFCFPIICVMAAVIYLARLLFLAHTPRIAGDAAFFSIITIYVLATLNGLFLLQFILPHTDFTNWYWWTRSITAECLAGVIFAPIGLILSLALKFTGAHQASFWRGSLATIVLAFVLYIPEGIWIGYHGYRLEKGDPDAVTSSLNALASSPYGVHRFGSVVCDSLFLRDISDPYFMYEDTHFLPDYGASIIMEKLNARFGTETQRVVDHAQSTFGKGILRRCAHYKNPSN